MVENASRTQNTNRQQWGIPHPHIRAGWMKKKVSSIPSFSMQPIESKKCELPYNMFIYSQWPTRCLSEQQNNRHWAYNFSVFMLTTSRPFKSSKHWEAEMDIWFMWPLWLAVIALTWSKSSWLPVCIGNFPVPTVYHARSALPTR